MRLSFLFAVSALGTASAFAAEAPPADQAAAPPPICTTVTTVVKRGDVILSTNSTTRCEDAAHPGGGFLPSSVLGAPEAVLSAPTAMLGAIAFGNGDLLTARNAAGDWRVVNSRTGDVCHLTLSVRTTQAGFVARGSGCHGELGQAGAWTYRDGAAEVLRPDGRHIVRLNGRRDQLTGITEDGDSLTLQR